MVRPTVGSRTAEEQNRTLCVPVFVELGGHLLSDAVDDVARRFVAAAGPRRRQPLVQLLDDGLLGRQPLLEVADALAVNVCVELQLGLQLRATVVGVVAQPALRVTSAHTQSVDSRLRSSARCCPRGAAPGVLPPGGSL